MKIEKISDNQIRCTLSHQDLEDREIKISELAYGTDKAKELFRDMMQQASYQFGFEADDIPLMIEAIPVSREKLILVITKVEDPDELDTRFSKFSPDNSSAEDGEYYQDEADSNTDQLFNSYEHISDLMEADRAEDNSTEDEYVDDSSDNGTQESNFVPLSETLGFGRKKEKAEPETGSDIVRIFSFKTLDEISRLAKHINGQYSGENTMYKNTAASNYYLVMHRTEHTPEEFNRVCNLVSEYGYVEHSNYATEAHFDEHFTILIKNKALQILANL